MNHFKSPFVVIILLTVCAIAGALGLKYREMRGPWYLGCADSSGQEYLIKVDERPYIENGFIVIGNDTFITPQQGMTCKIIPVKDVDLGPEVKKTSNSVI